MELERRWADSFTIAFSGAGNPQELVPAVASKRFIVTHLYIAPTGSATNLVFNSFDGDATDTALTGTIATSTSAPIEWGGQGEPVLIGKAVGDSLRVSNSATQTLNGFAVVSRANR